MKKVLNYRSQVRSRHNTHNVLRTELSRLSFRSVVRLGSTTDLPDTVSNGGTRVECNTVQAIKNSSNKHLMKDCFDKGNVKTAKWFAAKTPKEFEEKIKNFKLPIVAKHNYGSRGNGNTLIKTEQQLAQWLNGKNLTEYIFEKFYNYTREYRLHITKDGCFYTCRKLLKEGTAEDKKWFRNDSNCVWIVENNASFNKPCNWATIEEHCVRALKAVGLDIGACDIKTTSKNNPDFIILEINSAPSFGDITSQKYIEIIPKILKNKKA